MARISPAVERQVRIEMLRARATLERETLAQRLIETGHGLEPSNLLRSLLPAGLRGGGAGGRGGKPGGGSSTLWQVVSLARRFPMVTSTLSSFVLGAAKGRGGILKVAGMGLAGYQLYKAWRGMTHKDAPAMQAQSLRRGRTYKPR